MQEKTQGSLAFTPCHFLLRNISHFENAKAALSFEGIKGGRGIEAADATAVF